MTQTLNDRVAAEVRAELGRQRLSVSELARRLGWSQPYAQRRVSGNTAFDAADLERVCAELGVSAAALVADRAS